MRKKSRFTPHASTLHAPRPTPSTPHALPLHAQRHAPPSTMASAPHPSPPTLFEILPASWRDLNALRRIERECFSLDAWPLLDLIGVLSLPNVVRLKAVIDNKMIGFVAGDRRASKDMAWIATIGVLTSHRRRGIATALLQACEDQLNVSHIRLSVRAENSPALRLYEERGYQRVEVWPAYYQGGADAIVLEKSHIL